MAASLDSLLEATLAHSKVSSPQDALITAVHSSLLSAGYSLVAVGDKVNLNTQDFPLLFIIMYRILLKVARQQHSVCPAALILDSRMVGTAHKMSTRCSIVMRRLKSYVSSKLF